MPRRRKSAGGLGDLVDEVVEVAVDNLVDRARDAFAARAGRAVRDLPNGQTFLCVACNNQVQGAAVQFMRPVEGTCLCGACFQFLFAAGIEKMRFLAKRAAEQAAEAAKKAATSTSRPAAPPVTPPWEVLGVTQEASVDEIGKAYRKIVMEWHPDRLPPERRPEGEYRISEATKARNAMLSVRRKPTEGPTP